MATTTVGSLLVEMSFEDAVFQRGISRAQQSMDGAARSFERSSNRINAANGRQQQGMQQLSFQLNDISTQWASGTRPMQIFAQQSGQVIQALSMMSLGTGRMATFLAGPWGIALTAAVVALTPFIAGLIETATKANEATSALQRLIEKQRESAKTFVETTQAQIGLNKAREELMQIDMRLAKRPKSPNGTPMFSYVDLERRKELLWQIAEAEAAISVAQDRAGKDAKASPKTGGGGRSGRASARGISGPNIADIERRFNDEIAGIMRQYNDARGSMAMSAAEAAEYEMRNLELTRIRTMDAIKADKDYSAAQKEILTTRIEELAEVQRAKIEFELKRRTEEETARIIQQQQEAERESLQLQLGLADTDQERQSIALELLRLDQETQRLALERIIASETRTEAEKALAAAALQQLNTNAPAQEAAVRRQTETPWQQYMRELEKSPEQINEAIDRINIDGLNALNDGLVDAIMGAKSLGEVFSNVAKQILADLLRIAIQQTIIKPLANALFSSGGLSIPGFANGTNFAPGGLALVGERGPELVNLPRGAKVYPNGVSSQMMGGSQIHQPTFVFPGITDARMAREAGGQAARRYRSVMNGPVRGV